MNINESKVLSLVKSKEPTTPEEVADEICTVDGTASGVSEQYQETLNEVKSVMIDLQDRGVLNVNLEWEYETTGKDGIIGKIGDLIS